MMAVKAKQFKVGDKVRIIKHTSEDYTVNVIVGSIAEITGCLDNGRYPVRYEASNTKVLSNGYITPSSIELVAPTPKYKTVKRKANVGERILITNAAEVLDQTYVNGDVLSVIANFGTCEGDVVVRGQKHFVDLREYEVIVEDYSPNKPSKSARITQLESKVAELEAKIELIAQVEAMQNRRKPAVALTKAPNEQRKAVIERAKAFVTKHTEYTDKTYKNSVEYKGITLGWHVVRPVFIVNIEKRAVTVLLKGAATPTLYEKAIAKCAPDDVFNADIGKAIALGRAFGLDVSEFENAVKPTEVVVGQHVSTYYIDSNVKNESCPTRVTRIKEGKPAFENGTYSSVYKITDDTNAEYV